MNKSARIITFLLRISMGWIFLYAGLTKLLDSTWSAGGFLGSAQSFSGFYHALASPQILPVINQLNQWGLTLIGASLIIGAFVRLSSTFGILIMLLYYFPQLDFPIAGGNSYLVDQHIIYALVLLFLGAVKAGRYWGWDGRRRW
jgi:thiosulfate dehydrogenase [quinone] large subunit